MSTILAKIGTESPASVQTLHKTPPKSGQKVLVKREWWDRWLVMTVNKITNEGKLIVYHLTRG